MQTKTTIPIPNILDWSCDAAGIDNTIGSEYIIMEHAAGVQLHKKWQEMAGDQRVRCIDAIYRKAKEVVDLQFPCFGSLYLTDSPVSPDKKQNLDKEFCIGPHCGNRYWDGGIGDHRYYHNAKPNRGPCESLRNMIKAIANKEQGVISQNILMALLMLVSRDYRLWTRM